MYWCTTVNVFLDLSLAPLKGLYISAVVLLSPWRRMTPELELGALV